MVERAPAITLFPRKNIGSYIIHMLVTVCCMGKPSLEFILLKKRAETIAMCNSTCVLCRSQFPSPRDSHNDICPCDYFPQADAVQALHAKYRDDPDAVFTETGVHFIGPKGIETEDEHNARIMHNAKMRFHRTFSGWADAMPLWEL